MEKPSPKRLTKDEWLQVRAEWDSGLLSISEIARQFGLASHKAITIKASREGWPPRPIISDEVRALVPGNVPDVPNSANPGTNSRIALQSFERVIQLLRMHRSSIGVVHQAVIANLNRVAKIVDRQLAAGRPLTLKQEVMVAQILAASANSLAKLVPLERRAFGLGNEDISEFDGFTNEQFDSVENTIRKALE